LKDTGVVMKDIEILPDQVSLKSLCKVMTKWLLKRGISPRSMFLCLILKLVTACTCSLFCIEACLEMIVIVFTTAQS